MKYLCVFASLLCLASLASAKPPVPRPAKEFACTDANGQQISTSKFKGKVVLIQFLDTNCPHCQALSKTLTKVQSDLGPQGFQAFGVALNEATPEMVRHYVSDLHLGIPVGYAAREQVIGYLGFSVLERLSVPQVMIIDRRGNIRAQSDPLGTPELQNETYLREFIGKLLK